MIGLNFTQRREIIALSVAGKCQQKKSYTSLDLCNLPVIWDKIMLVWRNHAKEMIMLLSNWIYNTDIICSMKLSMWNFLTRGFNVLDTLCMPYSGHHKCKNCIANLKMWGNFIFTAFFCEKHMLENYVKKNDETEFMLENCKRHSIIVMDDRTL